MNLSWCGWDHPILQTQRMATFPLAVLPWSFAKYEPFAIGGLVKQVHRLFYTPKVLLCVGEDRQNDTFFFQEETQVLYVKLFVV